MVGRSAYDWVEYGESGQVRSIAEVVRELQPLLEDVEPEMVSFRAVASTGIAWRDWVELARLVRNLAATRPDAQGIVITHGTASLEETAWFLDLVVRCPLPVVLVGAQRPPNTAGSDAAPNLRAALAVAAAPAARDLGVLVVMDNYIHGARDVRKTSNFALDAFESGEFGPLGRVDADGTVVLRRRPSLPNPRPRRWRAPWRAMHRRGSIWRCRMRVPTAPRSMRSCAPAHAPLSVWGCRPAAARPRNGRPYARRWRPAYWWSNRAGHRAERWLRNNIIARTASFRAATWLPTS